jgi:hypothetical protein
LIIPLKRGIIFFGGYMAEIRKWRELREDGTVGTTLYKGLFISGTGQHGILLAKLSHGWRSIRVDNLNRFQFEALEAKEKIQVPNNVLQAALLFLQTDLNFQKDIGPYLDRITNT